MIGKFGEYRFVSCLFKQKTAYEMRISDWSSDVCSSDLHGDRPAARRLRREERPGAHRSRGGGDPGPGAAHGAPHGPGRHLVGGPGPENLHLLHRVRARADGRPPAVVRPARGEQLLPGLNPRLPHTLTSPPTPTPPTPS